MENQVAYNNTVILASIVSVITDAISQVADGEDLAMLDRDSLIQYTSSQLNKVFSSFRGN